MNFDDTLDLIDDLRDATIHVHADLEEAAQLIEKMASDLDCHRVWSTEALAAYDDWKQGRGKEGDTK